MDLALLKVGDQPQPRVSEIGFLEQPTIVIMIDEHGVPWCVKEMLSDGRFFTEQPEGRGWCLP